jgi:hypothetical protein
MNTIFISLIFPAISEASQLANLFRLMCQYSLSTPAKYDECEPIRKKFDAAKTDEIARTLCGINSFYWSGIGGQANGGIVLRGGQGEKTASFDLWTGIERLNNSKDLTSLIGQVATRFGCIYGYMHYLSEQEVKRAAGSATVFGDAHNPPMLLVGRRQLVRCIPNLYWANIFGPEYIAIFGGRERVASAPAAVVKELTHDTFYIQLTENIIDFKDRHAEVDALRERAKQYLGSDCFFDYTERFARTYRVPDLGWKEPASPPLSPDKLRELLNKS